MVLLSKYKQNLEVDHEYIYSYKTKVGVFDHAKRKIYAGKFWSATTSKHINYVASEYGYEVERRY